MVSFGWLAKPVTLAVALGMLGGSALFTASYAEATAYLTDDPVACANCHVMREHLDSWQKAGHHAVATCNDCHVPVDFVGKYWTKAEHGWRHSKGFTFQNFHEPIRIQRASLEVVQNNCVRCHGELAGNIADHAALHGESPDCVHCHARVGHGPLR